MNKRKGGCRLVAGVLLMSALTCLAAKREDVDFSVWRINGTRVTATAAQLNTAGTVAAYPLVTNVTVALARQALASVSNATATSALTMQRPGAQTPTITVTVQRPGAQTPTITVTPQAPGAVTPTITVTKQVGAVTATAVITPQTVSLTDTNGVTAIVWTNATCAVTIIGGDAVMTNATAASSALPDFITNATAVSSALLDYPTNATAACSALLDYPTNATADVTVTVQREAVAALTNAVLTIQRTP